MIGLMPANDLAVVVLAAGKGTRLKSSLAKVLHRAGGRTLVEHIVRACQPLKPRDTVVVVGHQAEQVAAIVEPLDAVTVMQQPQNGTGGLRYRRGVATHRRTAGDQRDQFGDLLLHSGKTLARAYAGETE